VRLSRYHLFLLGGLFLITLGPLAFTQPGPPGGEGGGGRFGGGRFDPKAMSGFMFSSLSGGAETFNVKTVEIPSMMARRETPEAVKEKMMAFLQKKGVSDGTMTKANFADYFEERMNERRAQFEKEKGGSATPGGSPSTPGSAPASPGGAPSGDVEQQAREMFDRLDLDKNGSLSADEMRMSRIAQDKERWDTNRNGTIEFPEWLEYWKMRSAERSQGRRDPQGGTPTPSAPSPEPAKPVEEEKRPMVYRAGKMPKELPSWFGEADKDKDGQVGLYEWKGAGRAIREFLAMDHNGDGFVTAEEVLRSQRATASSGESRTFASTAAVSSTPRRCIVRP
jgi:hypothetical protein